jgi:hypothetical protein
MTNGWNEKPAAGEHVLVVTHRPSTDREYADHAPFTFVDGVEKAITVASEFAGDGVVDVAAGQIGARVSASKQRQSPAARGELARDGEVCGDERAAVGRALDPELPVEGGKPVCQPEESAPVG